MTATVRVYKSTDASAPVLTGSAGALVTVLDAVLVNGYGSMTAAGWAKSYSGTNKAVYRNSATDGTGFYLYVDDTGPGGAGAREARMTGFQAATGLGTGTGQFPTFSQLGIGIGAVVCRKSASADATARAWTIVADDTVFYLFTETADLVNPTGVCSFFFGDFFSYASSDPYRCMIVGRNVENNNSGNVEYASQLSGNNGGGGVGSLLNYTLAGHFIAASWTGVGGSILFGKHTDQTKMGGGNCGSANTGTGSMNNNNGLPIGNSPNGLNYFPYPNGPDNGLYLAPLWIHHNSCVRGYFKGLWCPLQSLPLNHNDTFSGAGAMSGKSFLAQMLMAYTNTAVYGELLVETSNTWS